MEQVRITRRKATTRRPTREIEQVFPVPAADIAISSDEVTALLAHIDATIAED